MLDTVISCKGRAPKADYIYTGRPYNRDIKPHISQKGKDQLSLFVDFLSIHCNYQLDTMKFTPLVMAFAGGIAAMPTSEVHPFIFIFIIFPKSLSVTDFNRCSGKFNG